MDVQDVIPVEDIVDTIDVDEEESMDDSEDDNSLKGEFIVSDEDVPEVDEDESMYVLTPEEEKKIFPFGDPRKEPLLQSFQKYRQGISQRFPEVTDDITERVCREEIRKYRYMQSKKQMEKNMEVKE